MRTKSEAKSPSSPAGVTLVVKRFRDVLAPSGSPGDRSTGYDMKMTRRHPRVSIKGDDIHVGSPGATILFTIASSPGDKEKYYPVGIAFVREGEGATNDGHRLGMLNFAQAHIRADGRSLSITDSYNDEAPGVRHKFSVVIQRGSDGRIGIIDPGIVHEDDE